MPLRVHHFFNSLVKLDIGGPMSSIVDSPENYFRQLAPAVGPLLEELEEEARREKIPIVGPVVGTLLYLLARVAQARVVLELGTASGYSALFLARACALNGGRLVTLELDSAMAERAQRNLERAELAAFAHVVVGDALFELSRMDDVVDLVFMDIEKADYIRALPYCHRLLKPGGLLVADNVGFKDADAFNRAILTDPRWTSASLFSFLPGHSPEMDGICLALRG
jgi:predicted O-methyltransferase YrrM